ncbi:DUF4232 domain-containing protein [Micromonospora sp. CPCC 206061]|uniref:DUF4232 domain-containing protein n=1 Tax=Micromonospora sp. CPCC 206061 TaxID=3122410 RepID=UPI002FEED7EA
MHATPAARLAAVSATLVVLAACTDESTPTPDPTPPAPTATASPACPPSGVTLTAGQVEAASGLRAMRVEMANCGSQPYTANGYPALQVLDADRKPLDVTVVRGTAQISTITGFDGPPRQVTLAPGALAAAVVVWRNTVTDANVSATTGTYLEMAPAAGQPAQVLSPEGGIDLGTTGTIATSPWVAPT